VTALREQLAEMTTSRDNFERLCKEWRIEFDTLNAQLAARKWIADDTQEQLAQAKEVADMFEDENTSLRDTAQQLRAKQIHDDLPGILRAIQMAVEQARELI
jgi:chromosome segregation ATPase